MLETIQKLQNGVWGRGSAILLQTITFILNGRGHFIFNGRHKILELEEDFLASLVSYMIMKIKSTAYSENFSNQEVADAVSTCRLKSSNINL